MNNTDIGQRAPDSRISGWPDAPRVKPPADPAPLGDMLRPHTSIPKEIYDTVVMPTARCFVLHFEVDGALHAWDCWKPDLAYLSFMRRYPMARFLRIETCRSPKESRKIRDHANYLRYMEQRERAETRAKPPTGDRPRLDDPGDV